MPTAKRLPSALERLLAKLSTAIGGLTADLEGNAIDVDAWKAGMERELTKHAAAAYLAGARQTTLDELARRRVSGVVAAQVEFLDRFAVEIQAAGAFERGWIKRAESYSDSIITPYWAGRTKVLPLPALPGEGSQCGTRCKCLISVETIDADAGSYNARWVIHSGSPCQTCVQRAADWNPLEIRGGVLQ